VLCCVKKKKKTQKPWLTPFRIKISFLTQFTLEYRKWKSDKMGSIMGACEVKVYNAGCVAKKLIHKRLKAYERSTRVICK